MDSEGKPVVIVDIKIPFFSLVWFMTKLTLATIPATIVASAIILGLILGIKFGLEMLGISLPFNLPFNP